MLELAPEESYLVFETSDIGVLDGLGRVVLYGVLVSLADGLGRRQVDVHPTLFVPVVGDSAPGYALSNSVLADIQGVGRLRDG